MSWLCDVCGYENEFNDESQTTTCLCCGEPASESKIIKARSELETYHREEEKKARIERLKRKQELRQQRIDRIVAWITRTVRAIPVVVIVITIISFVWIGISFYLDGKTISAWNTQMRYNIKMLSLTTYPDNMPCRLEAIDLYRNKFAPIEETVKIVGHLVFARFSSVSENYMKKNEINGQYFFANIEELNKPITIRNSSQVNNNLVIFENTGDDLKMVGEHVPIISQSILNTRSNMSINFPAFLTRAKANLQKIVNVIIKREGITDD